MKTSSICQHAGSIRALVRVRRVCGLLALALASGCGGSDARPSSRAAFPRPGEDTPFIVPGIRQPEMRSAAEAGIDDDARVIGVVGPTAPRAYLIDSLVGVTTHTINDLIEGMPVSVTYCDRTDCVRVLTANSEEPIDLWTGGLLQGKLALRFQDRMYAQTSKNLPLEDYPFVVTSWKEWRESHPDTVVYVGGGVPYSPLPQPEPWPSLRPHSNGDDPAADPHAVDPQAAESQAADQAS